MVFRIGVVADIRYMQVPAKRVRFHLLDDRTGQNDGAFALESVFELRHEPNSFAVICVLNNDIVQADGRKTGRSPVQGDFPTDNNVVTTPKIMKKMRYEPDLS